MDNIGLYRNVFDIPAISALKTMAVCIHASDITSDHAASLFGFRY